MNKIKCLKDLYEKVKSGEIDESKLIIRMDNDTTQFYSVKGQDQDGDDIIDQYFDGNGYRDIEELYPILFPKADVDWV